MIKKFACNLTLDLVKEPKSESEWEITCKLLERMIEQTLETNQLIRIETAEAIIEEI